MDGGFAAAAGAAANWATVAAEAMRIAAEEAARKAAGVGHLFRHLPPLSAGCAGAGTKVM